MDEKLENVDILMNLFENKLPIFNISEQFGTQEVICHIPFKKKAVWSKIWRALPTMKFGLDECSAPIIIEKIKILGAP